MKSVQKRKVFYHYRQCVCVLSHLSRVRLFLILWTVALGLLCPCDSAGKNTGVGCHVLLQGVFLTQGSSPSLLHYGWILYHLSHREAL